MTDDTGTETPGSGGPAGAALAAAWKLSGVNCSWSDSHPGGGSCLRRSCSSAHRQHPTLRSGRPALLGGLRDPRWLRSCVVTHIRSGQHMLRTLLPATRIFLCLPSHSGSRQLLTCCNFWGMSLPALVEVRPEAVKRRGSLWLTVQFQSLVTGLGLWQHRLLWQKHVAVVAGLPLVAWEVQSHTGRD